MKENINFSEKRIKKKKRLICELLIDFFFCWSSVKRSALLFKSWKAYTVILLICTYCVLMFFNLTSQMAATVRWCPICSSQPSGVHLSCPTATEPATPNSTGEMVSPGLCLALVINSALSAPLQSVSVNQVWMAVLQLPVKVKDCVFLCFVFIRSLSEALTEFAQGCFSFLQDAWLLYAFFIFSVFNADC